MARKAKAREVTRRKVLAFFIGLPLTALAGLGVSLLSFSHTKEKDAKAEQFEADARVWASVAENYLRSGHTMASVPDEHALHADWAVRNGRFEWFSPMAGRGRQRQLHFLVGDNETS